MKNSIQTLRELSRRPYRYSAAAPYGNSAVQTITTLSRWLTAQFPCKHRLSALIQIFQHRFNLSAQILQLDLLKHGYAASCAALRRVLALIVLTSVKDKIKTSKGIGI